MVQLGQQQEVVVFQIKSPPQAHDLVQADQGTSADEEHKNLTRLAPCLPVQMRLLQEQYGLRTDEISCQAAACRVLARLMPPNV